MSFQNRRTLLAVFITLLIVFEMIAYVTTTPRPQERFFQLYVLGANHMAADYYPNNDTNIRLGESVHWYIGATDFMGNVQLIVVRIKLGNKTIAPPNDLQATPSPAPLVTEFTRFIQNNETWEFPFVWQIVDTLSVGNSTRILQVGISNETYQLQDSSATNGDNFRFIIELWTWNTESHILQFGWQAGGEHRVAWLQVWFNATTSLH
jgi:hypothetical protein